MDEILDGEVDCPCGTGAIKVNGVKLVRKGTEPQPVSPTVMSGYISNWTFLRISCKLCRETGKTTLRKIVNFRMVEELVQ